jgi:hypothetical protein
MARPFIEVEAIPLKRGKDFIKKDAIEVASKAEVLMRTKTQADIKREMRSDVRGWTHKPTFAFRIRKTGDLSVVIFPRGDNKKFWVFVSGGTKAIQRKAKTSRGMTFREGYTPHTTPGGGRGGPGTRFGKIRRGVQKTTKYKGIAARNFEQRIVNDYESVFVDDINNILKSVYK